MHDKAVHVESIDPAAALRDLVERTSASTGQQFFSDLVRGLCEVLGFRMAVIGELKPGVKPATIRTLAAWLDGSLVEPFEYPVDGTFCERVVGCDAHYTPRDAAAIYPQVTLLQRVGAECYLGVPLCGVQRESLGVLFLLDDRPRDDAPVSRSLVRLLAARAAAELERMRGEQALLESQNRFRQIGDAIGEIVFLMTPGTRELLYVNNAYDAIVGAPFSALGGVADDFVRYIHSDDLPYLASKAHLLETGQYDVHFRILRPDGELRWLHVRTFPIFQADRTLQRIAGVATDVTAGRLAEEKLRASEERLSLLVRQLPAVIWTTDRDLRFTSSRGAGLAALGLKPDQVVGQSAYLYLADRSPTFPPVAAHLAALSGSAGGYEHTVQDRVYQVHVEPLRDQAGTISGVVGVAFDITERKRAEMAVDEARRELEMRVHRRTADLQAANLHLRRETDSNRRLLRELEHRVRNNLAGLLSLVALMRRDTTRVDDFADTLENRLNAMVHIHHLLAEARWQPLDLRRLIASLLQNMRGIAPVDVPVQVDGPPVLVSHRQALPLAMVLVEWFTNSAKHGAHSKSGGRLLIEWEIRPGGESGLLRLCWRESGGPPVPATINPSLGTDLVHSFVEIELRGSCDLVFNPQGVDHCIEFPIDRPEE